MNAACTWILRHGLAQLCRVTARVDPFNEVTVLRSDGDLPKLFLHFGAYNEDMFKKAKKCNSYHLFCGIQNAYEPNGRHIMIKYNCDLWISPEDWLQQLN